MYPSIPAASRPSVRRRFAHLRADPLAFGIVETVARERGVSITAILKRSRGQDRAASARQLAMYLLHVQLRKPQDVVAELLRRDRTTVAHACQRVEDLRDDPTIDAEISGIEAQLRAAQSKEAANVR